MNDMNMAKVPDNSKVKKTLMNSVENLSNTSNNIFDLLRLSEILIKKMERTEGIPEDSPVKVEEKLDHQPTMIDLFDGINDNMSSNISALRRNLQKVIDMVD